MSLKNTLKVMTSRSGIIWSILLYLVIFTLVIVSLFFGMMQPIFHKIQEAGLAEQAEELSRLFGESFNIKAIGKQISVIFDTIKDIFNDTPGLFTETFFKVFALIFLYKFLLGYYELPVTDILYEKMSSNAKIGFTGKFFSNLGRSSKFILVKMLYTVLADAFIYLIIFLIVELWNAVSIPWLLLPFAIMVVYIVLKALRYGVTALWAPRVAQRKPIFKSFGYSVNGFGKNFSKFFGDYVIVWTIIIAVNGFVGLITFGAGLLITVPMSMAFICALNLVLYFSDNKMRFYIDNGTIVGGTENPATANDSSTIKQDEK